MVGADAHCDGAFVPVYMLCHRHESRECGRAFAAWSGFPSPLRHSHALGSCAKGGHRLWWTVEADTAEAALAQLPNWLALRTEVVEVSEVPIP